MSRRRDNHRTVRIATSTDAEVIGRLLHKFNTEFGEPTPPPSELAERMRLLLEHDDTVVLLCGKGPNGLAVLRFRQAIWSSGLECYLAELFVVPSTVVEGLVER